MMWCFTMSHHWAEHHLVCGLYSQCLYFCSVQLLIFTFGCACFFLLLHIWNLVTIYCNYLEITATPFASETPAEFCGLKKLHPTFHQHEKWGGNDWIFHFWVYDPFKLLGITLTWLWRMKAVCPWRRAGGIPTYRGTFHFLLAGETQCKIFEQN